MSSNCQSSPRPPWYRWAGALIALTLLAVPCIHANEGDSKVMTVTLSKTNSTANKQITVEQIDSDDDADAPPKDVTWLGVAAEEVSEPLAAQLGLKGGEGLLITYVADNSPASQAGVQKNDVLVKMDDQLILLPLQLRKLVQRHSLGDNVNLTYYRSGAKQNATATLAKAPPGSNLLKDHDWQGDLQGLKFQLKELPMGAALRLEMKDLQDSLTRIVPDKESLKIEVRRSLEEARHAAAEALKYATNAQHSYGAAARVLEDLARKGGQVEEGARVTVKSQSRDLRTMVTTDEDGSYVVVASPTKRLTAHDKNGKLVFDGEIETAEQQASVPRNIWSKVEPMLEQFDAAQKDKNP
jgi:hypothetical protein